MLVPHEAVIQAYETEIDIASKEYIEILQKYNQATLESNITPRLKEIEIAVPGPPAASKKGLLIAVSGIVPMVLYIIVLFVVFYLDDTLKVPIQLAEKTNIPVLGYLPLLGKTSLNLQAIWESTSPKRELQTYKDLLRSTRFELEQEMQDNKILTITSLAAGEGKTFVALSLAYAYTMAKKKVLLIDGNFDDSYATDITKTTFYFEDFISGKLTLDSISHEEGITVLGNKGEDVSLFELSSEEDIREKLETMKEVFDVIIIDASSLNNLNKSKEWIVIGEKVVSVYEANHSIKGKKELQVNYLKELDKKYIGWILNKVNGYKSRLKTLLLKLRKPKRKRKVK
jgi:Mrp family chromosome partitioning ATPase